MGSSIPKPAFESHICDNQLRRGEDLVLRCEANTPEVEVIWEKDGRRLYKGDRIDIVKDGRDLKLTVSQAKEEDEGKYTIRLKNDKGSDAESVTISILQYDQDWREINWGSQAMRKSLREYKLSGQGPKELRILLHGPVGSGKSSLINSINSVFQGKVKIGALASTQESRSFTKVYESYRISDKDTGLLPFVFSDVMGFEQGDCHGVLVDDIIGILGGHIPEKYEFNLEDPLSKEDPRYNSSPSLSEQVHCLISVLPADKANLMADGVYEKMREVRERASAMGIPQVVFMTRIDVLCPLVKDNLQAIYSSKIIKKTMESCSNRLGVPMNCIFPVKNYHEEIQLKTNMDSLILHALKSAVGFADDYVNSLHRS
ncbi:interferon-induced protein 44-like isoform X2 [Engraulis encrasicolus]|uniref:interferon-induced protein 44-like isoform X2 n=1 Tax=Engraulis encrasicolus TaxID=184585 RepID=UPI002FD2A013